MKEKSVSVALGTFDGIHLAHKKILENALKSEHPICITFKTPPKAGGFIMQPELKEKKLYEMGFKKVIMLDFEAVRDISPEDFLEKITNEYNITDFFCGYDYRFGKNGEGNPQLLLSFCEKRGLKAHIEGPIMLENEPISSSKIRSFLRNGEINSAIRLLGHPIEISAPVLHGDARGRLLGFPTINQALPSGFCEIKFGVYASSVWINGKQYEAITDIGIRPTYPAESPVIETHILDFSCDLYEEELTLSIFSFLREEKKFANGEELIKQIKTDINTRKGEL